jgi:hypothetical protein
MQSTEHIRLPQFVQDIFWDVDRSQVSWERNRDFITRRVLMKGGWNAIRWLRSKLGDDELRHWIIERKGRGLEPRQLRFWQLVLDIDPAEVDRWIAASASNPWIQRLHPRSVQQRPNAHRDTKA